MPKPKDIPKPKLNVVLGDSGTSVYYGIINDEYNTKLVGVQGIEIYDQMRKSDGTVKAAVLATQLPILRAQWLVQPASDEEADKKIAEFIHAALFEWQSITWNDFLRHALLMLPFGVMVFEKVFTIREEDGKAWIVWDKLAPRLPKSIQKWAMENGKDGIQQRTVDGKLQDIPIEKLCIFVHEKEGDNWWGNSILRAAYKHWYMKTNIEKVDAIAIERQGLGIPYYKYPPGTAPDDMLKIENQLKRMRAHEQAYVMYPGAENSEVGFLDMGGKTTRDAIPSMQYHNREIVKAVLAQFLELGATEVGSKALSQDHSELFLKSLEAVANTIKDVFNKYAIPQLVDYNFSNVAKYPTLEYAGISKTDVAGLVTAYNTLVNAGVMQVFDKDEHHFRGLLNLPEWTEEDEPRVQEEEEDEDQKKKMSEPRQFQESTPFTPTRKLTFAEEKVNFQRIQDLLDKTEGQFSAEAKTLLNAAKDAYVAKLGEAARKGDVDTVKTLRPKFEKEYKALLKEAAKKSFGYGKIGVAREMGVEAPGDPHDLMRVIELHADTIAEYHANQLVTKAKQGLVNALERKESIAAAMGVVDAILADTITKIVDEAGGIMTAGYLNQGRSSVFERNSNKIYALQRSELLDYRTCNYCLSVDGRIIEKDDSYARNTIFHSNCRGIWVEILHEEEDKPAIAGIPQSLRDRFGDAVNALLQPKNPLTKKNSLARKFLKKKQQSRQ